MSAVRGNVVVTGIARADRAAVDALAECGVVEQACALLNRRRDVAGSVELLRQVGTEAEAAGEDLVATRSLSNAALLCKHHHSETHRLNLSIQRLEKPPGWTRRRHAQAAAEASSPGALFTTHTNTGTPLRYVFRNHRGHIINAQDDPTPDG